MEDVTALHRGTVRYDEGVMVVYRYLQKRQQQPLFPFGFGQSYTSFTLSDLKIAAGDSSEDAAQVAVRVKNDGQRDGSTVVQLYAGQLAAPVEMPLNKLVGYTRVELNRGEERVVVIPVPRRLLAYRDEKAKRWISPRGAVKFSVGQNVGELPLQSEYLLK